MERRFWNEKIECMPMEEIRELQLQKIKKQVKYCYDNSPLYYGEKFKAIGVEPGDIKTWEDFRKLPPLRTKAEDRISQEESLARFGHPYGLYLCVPPQQIRGVFSTAGTTGFPTFYALTEHDIGVINEVGARGLWRCGVRPGDFVLHAMGLSMWIGGIPIMRAIHNLGACPIGVGAEARSERLLMFAQLTRPKIMFCTPSYAEYLIQRAPETIGMEVKELGISRIITAGEPGVGLPEFRKKVEDAYGATMYECIGFAFSLQLVSCGTEDYHGMHVACEDYCLAYDLMDPATNQPIEIKDGAIGKQIITSLEWEAAPALRYDIGDLVQVFTEPCVCGQPGYRVKVLGRIDDMLIVKGINVYPTVVKDAIMSFVPRVTGELRIVLGEPPPRVVPPLKVRVEYGAGVDPSELEGLKVEIEQKVSDMVRTRPVVELLPPGTLERDPTKKAKLLEKRYEAK